jgi:molybdenum cofactor cytidylyltransferase
MLRAKGTGLRVKSRAEDNEGSEAIINDIFAVMGGFWGIILAAGESKRMGFPKMLLTFNGVTMIENVILNVRKSQVQNIMVVLGANRDLLSEVIAKLPVKYCYNDNYKEGMLSSVKCGINSIPADAEALLVFQGDQPMITPDVINRVIEAYSASGKGIVIPVNNKKRGHPLLLDKKYRSEIGKLDAGEGLRSLAYKFSEDVHEVETGDPGILLDFDTIDDYKKNINQF